MVLFTRTALVNGRNIKKRREEGDFPPAFCSLCMFCGEMQKHHVFCRIYWGAGHNCTVGRCDFITNASYLTNATGTRRFMSRMAFLRWFYCDLLPGQMASDIYQCIRTLQEGVFCTYALVNGLPSAKCWATAWNAIHCPVVVVAVVVVVVACSSINSYSSHSSSGSQ